MRLTSEAIDEGIVISHYDEPSSEEGDSSGVAGSPRRRKERDRHESGRIPKRRCRRFACRRG